MALGRLVAPSLTFVGCERRPAGRLRPRSVSGPAGLLSPVFLEPLCSEMPSMN
jgi:hypothetical protein